jgi:polyhydroxyalkanoate synthesis repressor PhaR
LEAYDVPKPNPVPVKRYADRRIYDQATESFLTLYDIARLLGDGVEVRVTEAQSGEDVTEEVLSEVMADSRIVPGDEDDELGCAGW